jgi:hypothetical protein
MWRCFTFGAEFFLQSLVWIADRKEYAERRRSHYELKLSRLRLSFQDASCWGCPWLGQVRICQDPLAMLAMLSGSPTAPTVSCQVGSIHEQVRHSLHGVKEPGYLCQDVGPLDHQWQCFAIETIWVYETVYCSLLRVKNLLIRTECASKSITPHSPLISTTL